jgi:alpha/beta superfamily hydrolase
LLSATIEHGTVTFVSIETVTLTTIDGLSIEADIITASLDRPVRGGVVIAHPHPLYGGDRFNPVVDALFRGLAERGFDAIRFDFRGVGRSEGEHDGGESERLDVAAAIDFLANFHDEGIWVVGYSFGSMVALDVIEPRVLGWVGVAPPLSGPRAVLAARDPRPKLILSPQHDQFCDPNRAADLTGDWINHRLGIVEGTDHFLNGRLTTIVEQVDEFLVG